MTTPEKMRQAGIMLPLASLPSRHGIGGMGREARSFVDMLQGAGLSLWQILPLNPLGYGNSPYQPYSSFAGDPIYIDLEALQAQGLLRSNPAPYAADSGMIDYERVRARKESVLREAFASFVPDAGYEAFAQQPWAFAYAVFMAFKRANGMRSWGTWPEAMRDWPARKALDLSPYDAEIRFELFLQYVFYAQWMDLKAYANARGVQIVGDIPIYVGIDSLDVWMGRENFLLDEAGNPLVVAGVPPDYFSETGQRWGNPLYNWAHMEAEGFSFWIDRLRYSSQLFDIIRIDHFRGFDTYWEIPAACPTAVEGVWREAPGYALFDRIQQTLPGIVIIAEDLGMLRDEVYALRDHYKLRGMKILQFTFNPEQPSAPQAAKAHMVVYTGTHDNPTTEGWYRAQPKQWQRAARRRLFRDGYRVGSFARRFIRLALADAADLAIVPLQDVLGLDDRARLNTPGTVGSPNWMWRLTDFAGVGRAIRWYGRVAGQSGRRSIVASS